MTISLKYQGPGIKIKRNKEGRRGMENTEGKNQ